MLLMVKGMKNMKLFHVHLKICPRQTGNSDRMLRTSAVMTRRRGKVNQTR